MQDFGSESQQDRALSSDEHAISSLELKPARSINASVTTLDDYLVINGLLQGEAGNCKQSGKPFSSADMQSACCSQALITSHSSCQAHLHITDTLIMVSVREQL